MVSVKKNGIASRPRVETVNEYTIHTDILFDTHAKTFIHDTSIAVDKSTGLVTKVFERTYDFSIYMKPGDIDLSGLFVMPGFVDAHAHIFLHPYKYVFYYSHNSVLTSPSERTATEQMRDESLVERVIRATNHTRAALLAGYTTYRSDYP